MELIFWVCYTVEDVEEFESLHDVIWYEIEERNDELVTYILGILKSP